MQKKEKSTTLFEQALSKKEASCLQEIIADFDNYLASKYPKEESKFKAYLRDFSKANVKDYWKIDSVKLEQYREIGLFGKYDTLYPDSVWYDGQSFKISYPESEDVDEFDPKEIIRDSLKISSIISRLKNIK